MGRFRSFQLTKVRFALAASIALLLFAIAVWKVGVGREAKAGEPAVVEPPKPKEPNTEERYVEHNGPAFRALCKNNGDCLELKEVYQFFCSPDDQTELSFTGECRIGLCSKQQRPCQSQKCQLNKCCTTTPN